MLKKRDFETQNKGSWAFMIIAIYLNSGFLLSMSANQFFPTGSTIRLFYVEKFNLRTPEDLLI